jgi:tellurite resistance protein TehA-like permease
VADARGIAMSQPPTATLLDHLRRSVETMSPTYFSMVMATGILSLAAYMLGIAWVAWLLFGLNCLFFVVISALALGRACWHTRRALSDFTAHPHGPGFFTFVAACSVLGSQWLLIAGNLTVAILLGALGMLAWLLFTYALFTVLTVKENKPTLDKGINGGWLLAVVATQSMAVLASLIADHVGQPARLELNFFALAMWLFGGMLYIWMMSLIFYRYTFFRFAPSDLSPPYWINMGAMAISTLAGSQLIVNAPHAPFLASMLPFIKGYTVFYWATGTWWVPMLLILGVWRHGLQRFPFLYDPLYWGAVFPIGMYAACTYRMIEAMELGFLAPLPPLFLYAGLLGWLVVFTGQVRAVRRHWLALSRA